jgi:vitamin B12 transporter
MVTATRLPQPAWSEPDARVITAGDIAARQAVFATDILSTLPGVHLSQDGAFGGLATLRLRGASSDKTLVLVDGAEVNDPTAPSGGFDVSSLDLAEVEKIEVLSGPRGSLWGSDAIGGVVAITTREPDGWRAAAEAGAFGTKRADGSVGLAGSKGALGASVGWYSSGGISKADARDGNSERDGFGSFTAQANARLSPGSAFSLDGKVRYNRAKVQLDSFGGPTGVIDGPDRQAGHMVSGFLRARLDGPLGVHQELRADGMTSDRTNVDDFGGFLVPFSAAGRRLDLRWTAERTGLGPHSIMVGAERETARSDTGDGPQTSRNLAAFAIWRYAPSDRISLTASVRRDKPRDVQGVTTFRASGEAQLGAGVFAGASFGQGFKAPSIFERTYPCPECDPPGPARGLKPERARGWDLTLGWRGERASLRLTGYRLSVSDQIDYRYPQGYLNIARTRGEGLEAEATVRPAAGVVVRASYAYADAKDLSDGSALLRVPRHSGSVSLDLTRGRATAGLVVRAQSGARDVYGDIRPFAVADLTGAYAVSRHVQLTARIENLTDAHYQEAFGYGEPGFGLFVGVRLSE